jgi:cell division protein FtsA
MHGTEGNEIIAGLDLGTTKVCAIVAEVTEDGLDVIGVGSVPSRGLRRGVVVNIESTVQAIRAAVEQAETMAGVDIRSVYAGISGSHVAGMNKEGVAAVNAREVKREDVERVLEQARAIPLGSDREVLHVLPQEYIVDDQGGIREPVGMNGVRLQAQVHIVTAASSAVQNIRRCAERANLHVADVVLEPLASAEAVLESDEKEIGVALVDIGGGTSDIIVYVDGAVVHTSVIPVGGINVTNDIAHYFRTPIAEAERVKIKYGCASPSLVEDGDQVEVPSVGGRAARSVPRADLCSIIEPRVEEIFQQVAHVLEQGGYGRHIASGVVVTGGTAQIEGLGPIAEQILGHQVRLGQPAGMGGLVDVVRGPSYATAVGLVKYGAQKVRMRPRREVVAVPAMAQQGPGWSSRLGAWFKEVF